MFIVNKCNVFQLWTFVGQNKTIKRECVCWHVFDFFFLPQVVDFQSSSRFSLVILCLCGCCVFSISCIWFFFPGVDCYLFAVILHFFVLVSFYCVFTLLWSVYNSLQLVYFFVVILSVCDFFSFCYLVVILAVLLNLQFVLVILHLFVAAWGLTSVSLFWRFCNFCPASVFFGSLCDWCASLCIGLVFRLWTFGFWFFFLVPLFLFDVISHFFVVAWCVSLWKLMTVTLQ